MDMVEVDTDVAEVDTDMGVATEEVDMDMEAATEEVGMDIEGDMVMVEVSSNVTTEIIITIIARDSGELIYYEFCSRITYSTMLACNGSNRDQPLNNVIG